MAEEHRPTTEYDLSGLVRNEVVQPRRPLSDISDVSSISLGRVNPAFTNDDGSVHSGSRISVVSLESQLGVRSNTPVVLTRPDGSKVIITPNRDHRDLSMEEPELKERKIFILKIVSVLSIFLFFPTGIPAVVYAWRAEKDFIAGFQTGYRESARKKAKIAEILVILSLVIAIIMWAVIAALIERFKNWEDTNDGELGSIL